MAVRLNNQVKPTNAKENPNPQIQRRAALSQSRASIRDAMERADASSQIMD